MKAEIDGGTMFLISTREVQVKGMRFQEERRKKESKNGVIYFLEN